jgi:two-component system, chemotaxis family, chemotaxis protein CheY
MTILIVDDEPSYRLLLRNVLLDLGYEVIQAENGVEGLKKLQSNKVDLVISDIYMPSMDGIRFNRAARALPEFATIPFLFMSAFDDEHTLNAVKDPRYEGFLRKARPIEEIREWVTFLTTPIEKRAKIAPGGTRSRLNQQVKRGRG